MNVTAQTLYKADQTMWRHANTAASGRFWLTRLDWSTATWLVRICIEMLCELHPEAKQTEQDQTLCYISSYFMQNNPSLSPLSDPLIACLVANRQCKAWKKLQPEARQSSQKHGPGGSSCSVQWTAATPPTTCLQAAWPNMASLKAPISHFLQAIRHVFCLAVAQRLTYALGLTVEVVQITASMSCEHGHSIR